MNSSFCQLSIVEPVPYPTLQQIPSKLCILNIEAMDEKLSTLSLDIYCMNLLALQIKQSLMHLQCNLQYFRRCGTRLLALINCIFQQFGVDYQHLTKLVNYIRYCNGKWKKQLSKANIQLNNDPKIETVFYYKAERNAYLFFMLRTNNTITGKILQRLILKGQLHTANKKYLQSKGIAKSYESVLKKMMHVLSEKEEQTFLKIHLICEFIKYILLYVNLCITLKEQEAVFSNFLLMVTYLCRIIKKFYSQRSIKLIKDSVKLIKKGFQAFIDVFIRRGAEFFLKIQQIKLVIRLIQDKYHYQTSKLMNENAFIIRLLHNIVINWKRIHLKAQKSKANKSKLEKEQQKCIQVIKKKQSQNRVYKLNTRQISTLNLQIVKINKSVSNLNRRKSLTKHQSYKNLRKQKTLALSLQQPNNIKIRREIEKKADHYFQNISHLKFEGSFSKDKTRVFSCKKENGSQKQLKLEDYTNYFNSRVKVVSNSNKIQLYKADKMVNYYRAQPKSKLRINN